MYVWVECRADHLQTTQEIHSGIPEKNSQKCHSILEYIPQKTLQKKKNKNLFVTQFILLFPPTSTQELVEMPITGKGHMLWTKRVSVFYLWNFYWQFATTTSRNTLYYENRCATNYMVH